MDFDFYKEYSRCSNVELLRIMLLKDQYQPAAIEAVKKLLAERNITDEEQQQAQVSIAPKPRKATPVSDPNWQPEEGIFSVSATQPDFAMIKERWWLSAILLGLLVVFNIYIQFDAFIHSYGVDPFRDWHRYIHSTILLIQIGGYYLYLDKKKWGWILSMGPVCYMLAVRIVVIANIVIFSGVIPGYKLLALFALIVGNAVLLYRPALRTYYRIDKETAKWTLMISIGCAVLYCAFDIVWYAYLADGY